MAEQNSRSLDDSQKPFYLLLCLQQWINVVLDLLIACIAVGVIWLAVSLRGSTTGAEIGIALNVIILVNATLLRLVSSWTDVEISVGAVSRLKAVEETTPREEEPRGQPQLEESWPSAGAVTLIDVSAAYKSVLCQPARWARLTNGSADAVALRNVTLEISPGETVVVCGRTGRYATMQSRAA